SGAVAAGCVGPDPPGVATGPAECCPLAAGGDAFGEHAARVIAAATAEAAIARAALRGGIEGMYATPGSMVPGAPPGARLPPRGGLPARRPAPAARRLRPPLPRV